MLNSCTEQLIVMKFLLNLTSTIVLVLIPFFVLHISPQTVEILISVCVIK